MEVPRTPDGFDALLAQAVVALARFETSRGGSTVRASRAKLELLWHLDAARDFLLEVLRNQSDRALLLDIFGGDCTRIARIRAICEAASRESHVRAMDNADSTADASDTGEAGGDVFDEESIRRLRSCMRACESIEKVIEDLGLGESLHAAQEREAMAMGSVDDGSSDNCIEHVARASAAEANAIQLEREGDISAALAQYDACATELRNAIATAPLTDESDATKLQEHLTQVESRIAYLSDLNGEAPSIPVEQQIQTSMELALQNDVKKNSKLITACATLGAAGGFMVLGPLGAVLAAAAGAQAAKRDDELGERVRAAGEAAIRKTHDAKEIAANTIIDQKLGLVDKLSAGFKAATSKTGEFNAKYNVADRLDQKLSLTNTLSAGYEVASTSKAHLAERASGVVETVGASINQVSESATATKTRVAQTASGVFETLGAGMNQVSETATATTTNLAERASGVVGTMGAGIHHVSERADQRFKLSEKTSAIDRRFGVSEQLDKIGNRLGNPTFAKSITGGMGKALEAVGLGAAKEPHVAAESSDLASAGGGN
eukprot:TRINITY_DN29525_c0_g1_i1.p1 TRINITY_DN29525_c0_g1~~TRINITY_DN29525_c0_g1_i1.p1  ORF type:complete len:550 (+),score=133.66 TRINITY_DN29525_c0_g1_i1:18-1667(+)